MQQKIKQSDNRSKSAGNSILGEAFEGVPTHRKECWGSPNLRSSFGCSRSKRYLEINGTVNK